MAQPVDFSLRQIAVPAFGPSAIWSIGVGAVLPVVALSARGLGGSIAVAALFVGLTGLAEIAAAVPAGVLVERIGERRAIVLAGVVDAVACLLALVAPSLWVLALAVLLMGPSAAIFLLARQSYLTAAAPVHLRARAMSTLGGVTRIGLFIGPLVGAPVVARWGPQAAFGVAVAGGLLASLLAWRTTDLTAHEESAHGERARVPVARVVAEHRRVLLTVGLGVLVVPLWAENIGLDAAQTSLVFAAAAFVEVLLFWPAGIVMDRYGRVWVALPVALLLGGGLIVLPLTASLVGVAVVTLVMGVGNGIGSGIVMTLGADAAPTVALARSSALAAPFLGVWRLLSLVGTNGAAVVVAAVAAVASIAAASVAVGALTLVGGAWLARWLPEYDPRRGRAT